MKLERSVVWSLSALALGGLFLVACQETTSSEDSGPMAAYAGITLSDISRAPDSIAWKTKTDSGYGKPRCDSLDCTDTLSLAHALGSDTVRLSLWTLGIRGGIIPYTQSGRSPYLDPANSAIVRDDLDLRLLRAFHALRQSKLDSLTAFGALRSDLVYCYARYVFSQDTGYKGFPTTHPIGMSVDSVEKALVYWGAKSAKTWAQLVALGVGLSDSATVHAFATSLFSAGKLTASDTGALFPSGTKGILPPTLTPGGAEYSASQTGTVTLFSNTSGASLWYSTDTGTSKTWTSYSTALSITKSQIVYARAVLGDAISSIDSAIFLYLPTVAPASGGYATGPTVTISALGSPAIEDSLNTGSGWNAFGALTLRSSAQVCTRSRLGGSTSDKVCATYVLPPVMSPVSGTYADKVVVKASDAGADSVQFSTDTAIASGWKTGSTQPLTASGKLYARSLLGGIASPATSASYVVTHDSTLKSLVATGTKSGTAWSQVVGISGTALATDSLRGHTDSVVLKAVATDSLAMVKFNGDTSGKVVLTNDTATVSVVVHNGTDSLSYSLKLVARKSDTIVDSRDNQTYKVVKIGTQWWMAQNLNYKVDSSWCYNDTASYCETYGRLYQWAAAMDAAVVYDSTLLNASLPRKGVCPSGWHVPSDGEWTELTDTILSSPVPGQMLKGAGGWSENSGIDAYGFSAQPNGRRYASGDFENLGDYGFWWSSTEDFASTAWLRIMYHQYSYVGYYSYTKMYGFAIRCLEN
jgi:uncharacterized protein (TIGR02145 family)